MKCPICQIYAQFVPSWPFHVRVSQGNLRPVPSETPFEFPLDDENVRRRIKAARAMSGLSVETIGKRLGAGLREKTLRRIESGERPIRSERELAAIADATDQDLAFFTNDARMPWPAEPTTDVADTNDTGELLERLIEMVGILEGKVDATIVATSPQRLRRLITGAVQAALNQPNGAGRHPAPEGELGRRGEDSAPTAGDLDEEDLGPGTDAQPGSG